MPKQILLCWFVLLAIYCWSQGLPLSVVWVSRKTPLDKNWFFLCKCLPTRDSILVRDESFCPFPPLSAGILSIQTLCRPCAYCHSLYELKCPAVLLDLKDTVSLVVPLPLTLFLPPLMYCSLSYEDRGLVETYHLWLNLPRSLPSAHWSVGVLCVHFHLLQKKLLWRWLSERLSYVLEPTPT